MTWIQAGFLGFLIFAVGWVVEARLERLIKEVQAIRAALNSK
jgi:hypothetical protein